MVVGVEWEGPRFSVVVGLLFLIFSLANKSASRSGYTSQFSLSSLLQGHEGNEVEGWSRIVGESYARTNMSGPWRPASLEAVAPTILPFYVPSIKMGIKSIDFSHALHAHLYGRNIKVHGDLLHRRRYAPTIGPYVGFKYG
jgi:hypothetical protein